jgi:hypothetical protein
MNENSLFVKKQVDITHPSADITSSLSKEESCDYITNWHITSSTKGEKSAQTTKPTNNSKDQENLYPLYY